MPRIDPATGDVLLKVDLPRDLARWLRKRARAEGMSEGEMLRKIVLLELERLGLKERVH